jgi:hypothetical protein
LPCTWRQAPRPAPPAAPGSPHSSWGRFSTWPATVFRTGTSARAGSRSAAASRASSSSPRGEARSIRRQLALRRAPRLTSSTSFRSCARAEESSSTTTAGTARAGSRQACSSCSPPRFSPHSARHGAETRFEIERNRLGGSSHKSSVSHHGVTDESRDFVGSNSRTHNTVATGAAAARQHPGEP